MLAIFGWNFEIEERCKGVHCVDLGESFPTSLYLQKSASIQPRTSPSKFEGKFNSIFIRLLRHGQPLAPRRLAAARADRWKGGQGGGAGEREPEPEQRRRRCERCLARRSAELSWKVRYRTILWFSDKWAIFYGARSPLYRRQILQENIRWKALDEIYKIYMLLLRSDLNISESCCQTFSHFSAKFCKNSLFLNYFW